MKVKLLAKRWDLWGRGSFKRGDIVEGRERDLKPLVDNGWAEVYDPEAEKKASKPSKKKASSKAVKDEDGGDEAADGGDK